MGMIFTDHFALLEFELQQIKEDGDATAAESYKFLPKVYAKIYTNESIKELIDANPTKQWREDIYIFDAETHYLDLPKNWAYFISYYDEITDTDYPHWQVAPDCSDTSAYIKAISPRRLYNSNGWSKGDQLKVRVVCYPADIVDDTDTVEFEDNNMRLLRLHIIAKAFANKGKAMSAEMLQEYAQKYQAWVRQNGSIKKQSFFSFKGKSMGRRR